MKQGENPHKIQAQPLYTIIHQRPMKNTIIVIFLFTVLKVNGQQDSLYAKMFAEHRERFERAEKYLKDSNDLYALDLYHSVYTFSLGLDVEKALMDSNELHTLNLYHSIYAFNLGLDIETISRRRIDSLLPIVQKKEFQKFKGKWKLKQFVDQFYYESTVKNNGITEFKQTTNKYDYEYIIITDKEILFYKMNNLNVPSRIEEINFAEYDSTEFSISVSSMVFKNNEIWDFNIKKVNQEIRLYPDIIVNSNGNRHGFLLDERSMIRDSVQRQKALAKEIVTYYVLEE